MNINCSKYSHLFQIHPVWFVLKRILISPIENYTESYTYNTMDKNYVQDVSTSTVLILVFLYLQLWHVESKAYSCSICSLSFRRSDNLRRHMKNTHPGKNGRVIKNPVTAPQVTVAIRQNNTDTSTSQPVDNPNAINVIMTASAPSSAFCKAEVALEVHQQRQQCFELIENPHQEPVASLVSLPQSDCRASTNKNSNNGTDNDVTETSSTPDNYTNADATKRISTATTQQRSATSGVINGPIKLAFKTPAFKSSYNINR